MDHFAKTVLEVTAGNTVHEVQGTVLVLLEDDNTVVVVHEVTFGNTVVKVAAGITVHVGSCLTTFSSNVQS